MLTNFNLPNGVKNSGLTAIGASSIFTTGKTWYVHATTGSNGNTGDDPTAPKASVQGAITAARASLGDVVIIMPGHTETVTASSLNLSKAGIKFVCLGDGRNAPIFTLNAAASTVDVTAANVSWFGGIFESTILDCASAFTLGAAKNFTLDGATFIDTTAILNFLSIVTTDATDNNADDLTVNGNTWYGLNLVTPLAFLSILAAEIRPTFTNNREFHKCTAGGEMITLAAKIVTGADFSNNTQIVVGATGVTIGIFLTGSGTTSTGIVSNNYVATLDTTTELLATAGTGLTFVENYYTGTADKSAKLWPVVDGA